VKFTKRSAPDIAAPVLEAAQTPMKKTHIMYRTGIHMRNLDSVLEGLLDKELIEYDINSKKLRTTERGREYLTLYQSMAGQVSFMRADSHQAGAGKAQYALL
jgi:predicted transcriptional regulator